MSEQNDIETAAAMKIITEAAKAATCAIASAALDASKLLTDNAMTASRALNLRQADDHDSLIRLETLMLGIKADIKDVEKRLEGIEAKSWQIILAIIVTFIGLAVTAIKTYTPR